MRPPFVRVMPDEVERYGAAPAVVLAHIRYRCESDGPGRVVVAGMRWWRVSYAEFGSEVGLSGSAVRRALERLANTVEVAHHEPRDDPRRSYRIAAEQPKYDSGTPATSDNTNPTNHLPNSYEGLPNSTHPPAESDRCTTYRELGEVTREGGEAPTLHGELVDRPTQALEQTSVPPEPARYCSKHMPEGTTQPCGACGDARHNYTRWQKRYGAAWDALHPPLIGKATAKALATLEAGRRLADDMADEADRPQRVAPRYRCNRCRDRGIVLNSDGKPGRVIRICHCDGYSHHPAVEGELTDDQLAYARQLDTPPGRPSRSRD